MEKRDLLVIGGGPAGAATAIRAARAGVNVTVFEKGVRGRDKVCGDGLTPRAVAALHELDIALAGDEPLEEEDKARRLRDRLERRVKKRR